MANELTIADVSRLTDALFIGDAYGEGGVFMAVNTKGRSCVEALLPQVDIAWRDVGYLIPEGWHGFEIDLHDAIAATETKLPLEITRGVNPDEASADSLAYLLAVGVYRQGGRAAYSDNGHLKIFRPTSSNN